MKVRTERPPKVMPPMDKCLRAKQFAPFEALGSLEETFKDVRKECREEVEHIEIKEDLVQMCAEDADREDI